MLNTLHLSLHLMPLGFVFDFVFSVTAEKLREALLTVEDNDQRSLLRFSLFSPLKSARADAFVYPPVEALYHSSQE